jgi:hypothetical protein
MKDGRPLLASLLASRFPAMAWMHTAIDVMLGLDRRTVRAGKERMESSQVGSVGQSVSQSINQSINQLINQSIHCLARRTPQTPRSDQIRSDSTQLNSTQIKPDQVREPCRRVSSDIERGVVGWGCAARRCRCDAMHFSRSRRRFLFFACLLACWLAGWPRK